MSYIQGDGRHQGTLFPLLLDDLVPGNHVCRVIDAFVNGLKMAALGFERAEAADTGRPGYDPRDLLKLYLYGYLNQIRSSRRLEADLNAHDGAEFLHRVLWELDLSHEYHLVRSADHGGLTMRPRLRAMF